MRRIYLFLMPLTLFLLFFLFEFFTGVQLYYFVDPASVLMLLLVLLIVFCTFRPSEIVGYFTLAFRSGAVDRVELENALLFFRTVQTYVYYLSGITFIMGVVYILSVVPEMSQTGPKIAVALLIIFYTLLLALFVTLPFRASLRKKKNELEAGKS